MTHSQLIAAVADRAGLSVTVVRRFLTGLEEVVLDEIGNAEEVRIGRLVQLTVRVKPAVKAHRERDSATGEERDIAAKPASVDLRARPLAQAKGALPSVQKARRRLAGDELPGRAGVRAASAPVNTGVPAEPVWAGDPLKRQDGATI